MTECLNSSGFLNSSLVLTQSILHREARWSSKNLSWITSYCCQKLSDMFSMEEWKWTLSTVPQRPHVSCHHAPHHLHHSLPACIMLQPHGFLYVLWTHQAQDFCTRYLFCLENLAPILYMAGPHISVSSHLNSSPQWERTAVLTTHSKGCPPHPTSGTF